MRCASCQHENPSDALFCERCAADLVPLCPSCGQENSPGALYCRFCRASLSSEEPTPATRPPAGATPFPLELPDSFANGRYQVTGLIGEGGRKRVYKAHDAVLDRDIALAVIKVEGLDATSRVRITREAQALGRLGDHPHVLSIHDLGDDNGQPYLVLPLMTGGDVETLLASADDHRLPLEQAIDPASQICRGLEFAHSKGIVHRDLKPGNVWLTEDSSTGSERAIARIGDFGLAVAIDRSRLTQEGMMVGTVSYMPPEQAMGGDVTPQSDLYSLGAMLYELVTGRPPFLGDDSVAIIGQHINTPPVAPTWHNSECPRALEALIMRLLAKDSSERPASAADVLTALEGVDLAPSPEESAPDRDQANVLDSLAGGVFVGRQREMGELKAALEDALSGRGRLVMLVGEPGIGKTRTAEELATYARMRGAQVLWGRCHESRGPPPYWPWVQALRSYVREAEPERLRSEMGTGAADIAEIVSDVRERLPDLQPSPQTDDPEQARFRLFDSITAFLKTASRNQPLMVILDNLHWADKPSLLLLEFLAQEFADSRLLVVGTYRDVDLSRQHPLAEALGELTRERLFQRVLLRGLTRQDVGRFVEVTSGITPPRGLVEAVHTQTEGNPLFVTEVVRLLVQEGEMRQDGTRERDSWDMRIPEGVREVIGRRLNRLSQTCNETLTVASVIGREFEMRQLASLVEDMSGDRLLEVLEEALSARAIEELPQAMGQYQFTHALIRQTLYDELTTTRRVRLHARIIEVLENLHGDEIEEYAVELFHHATEAEAMIGSTKVAQYSSMAGEKALESYAFEHALQYFERALASREGEPIDANTAQVLFGLGRAKCIVEPDNLRQDGVELLGRAFDYFASVGDIRQALAVAEYPVITQAGVSDMHSILSQAIQLVPQESHEAARLKSRLARVLAIEQCDVEGAAEAGHRALAIAAREGDRQLEKRTLAELAAAYFYDLQYEKSREYAERSLLVAGDTEDPLYDSLAHQWASFACFSSIETFDITKAKAHFEELLDASIKCGQPSRIATAYLAKLLLARLEGDWESAREFAQAGDDISRDYIPLLAAWSKMECESGNYETGIAKTNRLIEIMRAAPKAPNFAHAFAASTAGYVGRVTGRRDLVEAASEAARVVVESSKQTRFVAHLAQLGLAETAALDGDAALARQVYRYLKSSQHTIVQDIQIDRVLGRMATLFNVVDAAGHFEDALAFCRKAGYRPELAWSCCDYADMLLERDGDGDRRKAATLLDESLAISSELGMRPLTERVLSRKMSLQGIDVSSPQTSIDAVVSAVEVERPDLQPHAAPDGTVTVMFTDIEGSTAMTERLGDQKAQEVIRIHNAIIRQQVAAHQGFEVKSQGDGFMMAFSSARRALDCAIAIQKTLAAHNAENSDEPIKVRIGLHTGEAIKEGDDFFGKSVILAARIASQAQGGKILVSSLLKALVESSREFDFGEERKVGLKGLAGEYAVSDVRWQQGG